MHIACHLNPRIPKVRVEKHARALFHQIGCLLFFT